MLRRKLIPKYFTGSKFASFVSSPIIKIPAAPPSTVDLFNLENTLPIFETLQSSPESIIITNSKEPKKEEPLKEEKVTEQSSVLETPALEIAVLGKTLNNSSQETIPNPTTKTSNGVPGKFTDRKEFARTINAAFRKVLKEKGMDPNYSYTLAALASMESGWGKAVPADYNFSGITVPDKTAEKNPGMARKAWAKKWSKEKGDYMGYLYFRRFKSIEDYCRYKIELLSNKRYNAFNQFSPNDTYSFIYNICKSGYGADYGGPKTVAYALKVTLNRNTIYKMVNS